jgi:hypothetical protein
MGKGRLAIACEKRKEEKRRVGMGNKWEDRKQGRIDN